MRTFSEYYSRCKKVFLIAYICLLVVLFVMPFLVTRRVDIDKAYTDQEDVALYLYTYHELPKNYVTYQSVETAKKHNANLSGYVIGGDTFYNREGKLSQYHIDASDTLKECDIRTNNYNLSTKERGTCRLVYTTNQKHIRVFYTADHYGSFTEMTGFRMQLARNVFWIIFAVYLLAGVWVVVVFWVMEVLYRKGIIPGLPLNR